VLADRGIDALADRLNDRRCQRWPERCTWAPRCPRPPSSARTARYRLGRLAELTGIDPDATPTVLTTLRWWWALSTWHTS
jgi:hypothetical protein